MVSSTSTQKGGKIGCTKDQKSSAPLSPQGSLWNCNQVTSKVLDPSHGSKDLS